MKILTLTLNPAYDVHATADRFRAGEENLITVTSREAGGKGVNVSRALLAFGIGSLSVILTGRDNDTDYVNALTGDGLSLARLSVPGRIRENLTVHDRDGVETRISYPGFSVSETVLTDLGKLLPPTEAGDVVTLTGSLPVGLPLSAAVDVLRTLRSGGVKTVVDSKSFTPEALFSCAPYLIKPNRTELSDLLGEPIDTIGDAAKGARMLCDRGIENVLVTLGADGALLADRGRVLYAPAPSVKAVSTVGAGDSTIAGFLAALSMGYGKERALELACAFGSAACLSPGTKPPRKWEIDRLFALTHANLYDM